MRLLVDAFSKEGRHRSIPAIIRLDGASANRSRMVLLPDKATGEALMAGKTWRLLGHFVGFDDKPHGYVHIPRFDVTRVKHRDWAPKRSDTRVLGYPSAIIVAERYGQRAPSHVLRLVVSLHGASIVQPAAIIESSDLGWVKYRRTWRLRARIEPHTLVAFDRRFDPDRPPSLDTGVVVLTHSMPGTLAAPVESLRRHLPALEDLLALVRIAGREWTAWQRIDASDGTSFVKYFNLGHQPGPRRNKGEDPLIPRDEVEGFLARTFTRLRVSPLRNELLMASYVLAPHSRRVLDAAFLSTFSCLEALVNRDLGGSGSTTLLDKPRWRRLRRELQRLLLSWQDGSGVLDPPVRERMCRKLPELNRAAFADVWSMFVSARNLPVADLWPMVAGDGELDLYTLRNRLAHGEVPPAPAYPLLMRALDHLRWVLERAVLTLLGYDLRTTDVSPFRLPHRGYYSMDRMPEYRRAITAVWRD